MDSDLLSANGPEACDLSAGGSPALYDPGEEQWPNRLHLGCGGIYLRGYLNIDIAGRLAESCMDPAARANGAWIWDYYGGLRGSAVELPTRRETVADRLGDLVDSFSQWGFRAGSIDKVVCIQMFEHLAPAAAYDLISVLSLLIRRGRPLILSVPDMTDTINWLEWADRETVEGAQRYHFAIRHLRGSRRDAFNHHKAWYTEESLADLLQAHGFRCQSLPNFHVYPAVVLRAVRE